MAGDIDSQPGDVSKEPAQSKSINLALLPFWTAVAGAMIGIVGTLFVTYMQTNSEWKIAVRTAESTLELQEIESAHEMSMADRQFETQLIFRATETENIDQAEKNLQFLIGIGLIGAERSAKIQEYLLLEGSETLWLPSSSYLDSYFFNVGAVSKCFPNDDGTFFEGHTYIGGVPQSGLQVVYSREPDGIFEGQPAITGQVGEEGYYKHVISTDVPTAGNWYVWVVNGAGKRISEIITWRSTGLGNGGCNQAFVDFDAR